MHGHARFHGHVLFMQSCSCNPVIISDLLCELCPASDPMHVYARFHGCNHVIFSRPALRVFPCKRSHFVKYTMVLYVNNVSWMLNFPRTQVLWTRRLASRAGLWEWNNNKHSIQCAVNLLFFIQVTWVTRLGKSNNLTQLTWCYFL